jgi:hypothetical protein
VIYPRIIQWVLFPIWVAASAVAGFTLAGTVAATGAAAGHSALGFVGGAAVFLAVFPLLVIGGRVPLEFAIVVFRIYDRQRELTRMIGDLAEEEDGETGGGS